MTTINPGMKVYSYCYGSMTVKTVDEKYITLSVDNPSGLSKKFAARCERGKTDLNNIKFMAAALGHWYFDSAADVEAKKENNNFPEANQQSGFPRALVRNDEYLHSMFGGFENTITGLTEKANATTGLTEKGNTTTGLTEKHSEEKVTGLTEK